MPPLPLIPNQPIGATDIVPNNSDSPSIYNGASGRSADASSGGPDPYQAIIEAQKRLREESDRNYKLQLQELDLKRSELAQRQGAQAATEWYNRQSVELAKQKLAQDQSQYTQTQAELKRQFDLTSSEKARQFDLTTEEGRRQYNLTLAENQRQFDAAAASHAREFDATLGENQRQFDQTSSGYDANGNPTLARQTAESSATGYWNGAPTLAREQFGNSALFDWTKQAIDLASTPADWIKYKRYTSGVADNAGEIPGLAWTQGGQVGNTTFQGNPQSNSLTNVLGNMGVTQQPGGTGGPGPAPGPGVGGQDDTAVGTALHDALWQGAFGSDGARQAEFERHYREKIAGGDSHIDAARGAFADVGGNADLYMQSIGAQPVTGVHAPVSPGRVQNGQGVVTGTPAQQADASQAGMSMHATDNAVTNGQQVYAGGSTRFNEGGGAPVASGGGLAQVAPPNGGAMANNQPLTNWALQAAGMVDTSAKNMNLSPDEQQIYQTADAFARNPQGAAPNWYEQLDPSTKEMIRGAAQAQGHDWSAVMSRYSRSRWGGGGSAMAA